MTDAYTTEQVERLVVAVEKIATHAGAIGYDIAQIKLLLPNGMSEK